ncbi:MAG TPA: flagellar hook-basal body complex protein [Rhodospirillales bacterium]|nr:flagellar hook-basal body complex protein [Rhodospirillales bacterium]
MSLYGAMFSGVSGLNANSQALGAIADNITNVNTIGYKATTLRFQTLVTAQASATGYSPGGVQQRPHQAVDVQGLFQSSTNTTDLAISGNGMFVVAEEQASGGSGAAGFNFTRAGAFTTDKNGYLKNTAGHYLQGYRTNGTGQTVDSDNVVFNPDPTVFTNMETIRLNNIGGSADATEQLTFGANLNAEADVGDTSNTTIQVYDSLGVSHNLAMMWTKSGNNVWDLSIEPPSGGATANITGTDGSSVYAAAGRIDFTAAPADGEYITVTNNGGAVIYEFDPGADGVVGARIAVTYTAGEATGAAASLLTLLQTADTAVTSRADNGERFTINSSNTKRIDINQFYTPAQDVNSTDIVVTAAANTSGVSNIAQVGAGTWTVQNLDLIPTATPAVSFNGSGIPNAFNVDDIGIDTNNGSADLSVDFDFGTVGMANGLTQFAAAYSPSFIDTDGAAFGQFSGVTISEGGIVTALFANGDVRPIYKIPIATFPNPNGLGANSGNVYNQTDMSGLMFMRGAGTGGAGKVQMSVLESSTVDIAKEFTTMITTQRAYSASAKIISTANEMLEELMRVKR